MRCLVCRLRYERNYIMVLHTHTHTHTHTHAFTPRLLSTKGRSFYLDLDGAGEDGAAGVASLCRSSISEF